MTSEEYDALSEDEKRIKAAEAAGWQYEGHCNWMSPGGCSHQALYPSGGVGDVVVGMGKYDNCVPPQFLYDLNDIHDAVMEMNESDRNRFWLELGKIVLGCYAIRRACQDNFERIAEATAEQRAKAFVLTRTRD